MNIRFGASEMGVLNAIRPPTLDPYWSQFIENWRGYPWYLSNYGWA